MPLAAAAALACGIPFLIVRKATKEYGTEGRIEGVCEPGERVLVIEDVVTTGGALIAAIEALRAADLVVETALCVLDREEGGAEALAALGVRARAALPPRRSRHARRLNLPSAIPLQTAESFCTNAFAAVQRRPRRARTCAGRESSRNVHETAWPCGFLSDASASVLAVPNRGGIPRDQG